MRRLLNHPLLLNALPASMEFLGRWLLILFPFFILRGHAYADIALTALAVIFVLHSLFSGRWGWLSNHWVKLALFLWGYLLLRDVFTEHYQEALKRSLPFIRYILFAAAIAHWLFANPTTRKRFTYALAVVVCILIGDGFYQYLFGKDFLLGKPLTYLHDGTVRLTGPFSNARLGIVITCLGFPIIGWLLQSNIPLRQLAGIALTCAIGIIVFLSGERSTWPLFFAGLGFLLFMLPYLRSYCWMIFPVALLALCILYYSQSRTFERQVTSTYQTVLKFGDSVYGQIWKGAGKSITEHPLFGLGGAHFRHLCDKREKEGYAPAICNVHPHNFFLEWLVEYGVIGTALFMLLIGSWLTSIMHGPIRLGDDGLYLGAVTSLLIRLWPLVITTSFFTNWSAALFWLSVGMAMAYATKR